MKAIYLFKVLGQDATYMEIVSGLHIAKKEQEATNGYQAVCILYNNYNAQTHH